MKSKGFTLIELMVVVVIIGILAAIAIPNFIAMQERAKQSSVKGNMHTAQLCVEAYACDYNGAYPVDDNTGGQGFGYYFPGGDEDIQTVLGAYPNNPYTGAAMVPGNDFNCGAYAAQGDNSDQTIGGPNDWAPGLAFAGQCRYNIFPAGGPYSEWGIIGCRKDGMSIRGGNLIHVLHN